jgi:hypothetical protein
MKDIINKDIILYFGIALIILVYGLYLVFPKFTSIADTISQTEQTKAKIQEFEAVKKQKDEQKTIETLSKAKSPVKVFKSIYTDLTVENSAVELVDQIITMLQETDNSINEISYNADSIDEQTKAKLPGNFHVLSLKLSMNSSYLSIQNFFKRIYVWDYLYGINNFSLVPNVNNPRHLDIKMDLWLYIEK